MQNKIESQCASFINDHKYICLCLWSWLVLCLFCRCIERKVKCVKPVVTFTLNFLPTILRWCLSARLPWLPDTEGTSSSICAAAVASTLPGSNLSTHHSFHQFFPLQYKQHSPIERKIRSRLLAFWKHRHRKSWTQSTKARERQATGAIKNSWPIEEGTGSPAVCELHSGNFFSILQSFFFLLMFSNGFQAFQTLLHTSLLSKNTERKIK